LLALRSVRSPSQKLPQTGYQKLTHHRSPWGPNRPPLFAPRAVKKRNGSPSNSRRDNCLSETREPLLKLGATKTRPAKAVHVALRSSSIPGVFRGLVDSGSSNCFISSVFALTHDLKTQTISPLSLSLIDGTVNNIVSQVVNLPIKFDCGSSCQWDFFVTTLDDSCEVVLGHDWLQHVNPSINWRSNKMDVNAYTYKPPRDSQPNSNRVLATPRVSCS